MEEKLNLKEALNYIHPASLDYQSWVNVGMALKHEGYPCDLWDAWSQADRRYHAGECDKKWRGFHGAGAPVTGGTIIKMAMDHGWHPGGRSNCSDTALDWDSVIGEQGDREGVVVDTTWLEGQDVPAPPADWNPAQQLTRYLELVFDSTENVGFVTKTWVKDGKHLPTPGSYSKTAGQLLEALSRCNGDIGAVIGDHNPEAGAWIRFNPLDGKGVKNENVTEFRYALVESDSMELGKQNAIIRELELPVVCLVHSGNKSLHAIVHIDASDYGEYRKRVDFLYAILKKNGMDVDTQNKNPSRLSRLPGVTRNGNKQYIVDANIGKASWAEWREWIEGINDDLPDTECLADTWNHPPELAPPLIDGVLRQGHKMLLSGPSKAGKSFALIELTIAIAEGIRWMGFPCARGRVLYVNLELDRASCLHRFHDVYQALELPPSHLENVAIWNLRGKSIPMDKLAPKLIRRATKQNYIAVIIDPIYKVLTGDESKADDMANFCNQFDKVCTELGCAVIYCHHHSKGAQGGKSAIDRSSGSGVFARDPDAILDMIELEITDDVKRQMQNNAVASWCLEWLRMHVDGWEDEVSQDDMCSSARMLDILRDACSKRQFEAVQAQVSAVKAIATTPTGWRLDGTLREFAKFAPVNVWFRYPVHQVDNAGLLTDQEADVGLNSRRSPYRQNFAKKKTPAERAQERKEALETAIEACAIGGDVTVKDLVTYMGITDDSVRKRIKEHGGYTLANGVVIEKPTRNLDKTE